MSKYKLDNLELKSVNYQRYKDLFRVNMGISRLIIDVLSGRKHIDIKETLCTL
jgi:hypothetical protein